MINSGLALVCVNSADQVEQKLQNYVVKPCAFGKYNIMQDSFTHMMNPLMINGLLTSEVMCTDYECLCLQLHALASMGCFFCSFWITMGHFDHFGFLLLDWYYSSNLKPSVNSKDLGWPVTGRRGPTSKNKCMNQHLSYKQGENSPQSKKYTNKGV